MVALPYQNLCDMANTSLPKIFELLHCSTHISSKIEAGSHSGDDFTELHRLSDIFSRLNKHAESLFCKKLQVEILYEEYKVFTCPSTRLEILEQAHDLAVDIVIIAEAKKVITASFYKVLLFTKKELASLHRSLGFFKDAGALEKCAARIYHKAKRLFPTYTKLPVPNSQTIQTTYYE